MPRELLFMCDECGHELSESKIIVIYVDHPKPGFDRVAVNQCPECGAVEQFKNMCDEPRCRLEATCGWPTIGGDYRRTCGPHMTSNESQQAKR